MSLEIRALDLVASNDYIGQYHIVMNLVKHRSNCVTRVCHIVSDLNEGGLSIGGRDVRG